jgi:hypothetical protein
MDCFENHSLEEMLHFGHKESQTSYNSVFIAFPVYIADIPMMLLIATAANSTFLQSTISPVQRLTASSPKDVVEIVGKPPEAVMDTAFRSSK